jgi:hypothetical protein
VLLDGESVLSVIPKTSAKHEGTNEVDVDSGHGSPFVVADAQGMLLDLIATMRSAGVDIAIVTATGQLETPDDMIGVIDWDDIANASDIPLPMLTGQSAGAKPTPPSTPHN